MNRQKGFSIIELLTVIIIIAILAGALLPALRIARQKAMEGKARAMIDAIGVALTAYHLDFSKYVPDGDPDGDSDPSNDSFVYGGTSYTHEKALHIALTTEFTGGSIKAGPYMELREDDVGPGMDGSGTAIHDPWDTPYQYDALESEDEAVGANPGRGCREHNLDTEDGNENRSAPGDSHNSYSFDIWSFGINKTNENGRDIKDSPRGDDVNNW